VTDLPRHYLDSGIFSGFLNGEAEPENFPECEMLIRASEQGTIRAFTSAFTMGEVVYIKPAPNKEALPVHVQEEIISQLLNSTWLERSNFEPDMAEINRYLLRRYGEGRGKKALKPFDSIHLATAIRLRVNYFNTLDNKLIELLPESISYPPIYPSPVIIQRPFVDQFQMQLPSL
jgi:predicted nucleic acid-binding protein